MWLIRSASTPTLSLSPLTCEWPRNKMRRLFIFFRNLMFFRCGDEKKVLTLHQEKAIALPGCPQPPQLCPLNNILQQYQDSLSNCNLKAMCAVDGWREYFGGCGVSHSIRVQICACWCRWLICVLFHMFFLTRRARPKFVREINLMNSDSTFCYTYSTLIEPVFSSRLARDRI